MPYHLFTFRPQISEQSVLDNFLTIFLPEIKSKSTKFTYSIECPNTLFKHIHILAETKAKDKNAFHQLFNKKNFKLFQDSLKHKQTNKNHAFDDRLVKDTPDDLMKVIGYVNKADDSIKHYEGFTNEQILQGVKYYYTHQHLEKKAEINNSKDWTILTTKNAHVHIEKYAKDNNYNWDDFMVENHIKIAMIKDRYTFSNFSRKTQSQIFNEIIIANTKEKNSSFHHNEEMKIHIVDEQISNDIYKTSDSIKKAIAQLEQELLKYS